MTTEHPAEAAVTTGRPVEAAVTTGRPVDAAVTSEHPSGEAEFALPGPGRPTSGCTP
ncbi:hypothetical protein ACFQ60_35040 [Streptomyces zhihengii]